MQFKGISPSEKLILPEIVPHRRGQIVSQNLIMNNRCDMRLFSFDQGEEVGKQISKADILYWIYDGEAEIELDEDILPVKSGELIVVSRGRVQGIRAVTAARVFQISLYEKETEMSNFIKNIDHCKVLKVDEVLGYEDNKVASMTIAQNDKLSLTFMSFDEGEGISAHAAGGDAMVQVLDGSVEITIDQEKYLLTKGETIVMPAKVPHSLKAVEKFKMFLAVVR